jgi:hypothetical protein
MKPVKIEVVKSPTRKGYSLKHNQENGFMGTIREDNIWAWYKYKEDAEKRAKELMNSYNK